MVLAGFSYSMDEMIRPFLILAAGETGCLVEGSNLTPLASSLCWRGDKYRLLLLVLTFRGLGLFTISRVLPSQRR